MHKIRIKHTEWYLIQASDYWSIKRKEHCITLELTASSFTLVSIMPLPKIKILHAWKMTPKFYVEKGHNSYKVLDRVASLLQQTRIMTLTVNKYCNFKHISQRVNDMLPKWKRAITLTRVTPRLTDWGIL